MAEPRSIIERAREALVAIMEDDDTKPSDRVAAAKVLLSSYGAQTQDPEETLSPQDLERAVKASDRRIDSARKRLARLTLDQTPSEPPPVVSPDQDQEDQQDLDLDPT